MDLEHAAEAPVVFVDGPAAASKALATLRDWQAAGASLVDAVHYSDMSAAATSIQCACLRRTSAAMLFAKQLEALSETLPRKLLLVVVDTENTPGDTSGLPWARVGTEEARAFAGDIEVAEAIEACMVAGRFASVIALQEEHQGQLDAAEVPASHPSRARFAWHEMRAMRREAIHPVTRARAAEWMRRADRYGWAAALVRVAREYAATLVHWDDLADAQALRERAWQELDAKMKVERLLLQLLDARMAEKVGDLGRARSLTDDCVATSLALGTPWYGLALRLRARILRQTASFDEAVGLLEAAPAPESLVACAELSLELAACLMGQGQLDRALSAAEEGKVLALELAWHHPMTMALTLMGEIHREAGRLDQAAALYQHAQRISDDSPYLLANLGLIEAACGRHPRAIALIDKACATSHSAPSLHMGLTALALPSVCALADDRRIERCLRAVERFDAMGLAEKDVMRAAVGAAQALDDARGARALRVAFSQTKQCGDEATTRLLEARLDVLANLRCPIPVGDFDLQQQVGSGGAGQVWSAVHRATGLPAAVKVLAPWSGEDARRRFKREVGAVAGLEHPNIVTVLDHGDIDSLAAALGRGQLRDGCTYMAMELVPGGTLQDVLAQLPWHQCKHILEDLLAALAHAHAHGVVHRDLKPENVLLPADPSSDRGARLADFGVAYGLEDANADRSSSGTPLYMAPEQFQRRPITPATDLYALGCLTVALVTGAPPYTASSIQGLAAAHIGHAVPALQPRIEVPEGLEAWVGRLLQKHPDDRFQLAADALCALNALGPPTVEPVGDGAVAPGAADTVALTGTFSVEAGHTPRVPAPPMPLTAPPLPAVWPRDPAPDPLVRTTRLIGSRRAPMCGREREQQVLWEALRDAGTSGAAVTLHSEPGMGRSRLWAELRVAAHRTGAAQTIVCIRSSLPSAIGRFLRLPDGVDAAFNRLRMLVDDGDLAHRLSRGGSDEDWLQLLAELTVKRRHIIVAIGTCPGVEAAAAEAMQRGVRALWLSVPDHGKTTEFASVSPTVLRLEPLTTHDAVTMLDQGFGLVTESARRLAHRAGGQPLFLIGLVQQHAASLEARGMGLALVPGTRLDLPDALHELCTRELEPLFALDGNAVAALTLWSMVGQEITEAQWSTVVASTGLRDPRATIDELREAGLIHDVPGGMRLRHALLAESLIRRAREVDLLGGLAATAARWCPTRYDAGPTSAPHAIWRRPSVPCSTGR